jgi:hypothetical protein
MKCYQAPEGAWRVRRDFLIWPKTIESETRWLEWACWVERRRYGMYGHWLPERWSTRAEYERWRGSKWYVYYKTGAPGIVELGKIVSADHYAELQREAET